MSPYGIWLQANLTQSNERNVHNIKQRVSFEQYKNGFTIIQSYHRAHFYTSLTALFKTSTIKQLILDYTTVKKNLCRIYNVNK
jgi:hypothetical protein